jgi:hypothetical protein
MALSQNCEKRLSASSCLSVFTHGTTRLPLDGFLWNLIFEKFLKICRTNSIFTEIWQYAAPYIKWGPGISVGIAIELRAERSGDRVPVGRDFPPVRTGPGAHPASCTMGTGSFPVVKCGRGVPLPTPPLLAPRSWKSRAIPLPPPPLWDTTGPVTGLLYFTLLTLHENQCTFFKSYLAQFML